MATDENETSRLEQILQSFLALQCNENTSNAYANDLQGFFQMVDHVPLDQIAPTDIVSFRRKISHDRKPSTVARKLIVIRRFFTFCTEKRYISFNPTLEIKLPRVSTESSTNGLTKAQAETLLQVPDTSALKGKRDYAILSLILHNALRRSEIFRICWGDFGEERGYHVLRGIGKGGKAFLTKIKPKVMKAVEAYRAASNRLWGDQTPVFVGIQKGGQRESTTALSPASIRLIVKQYARMAGIEKDISAHSLRHTAITLSLDGGATIRQVQYLANHRNPQTTMLYDRHRINLDDHATDYINLKA